VLSHQVVDLFFFCCFIIFVVVVFRALQKKIRKSKKGIIVTHGAKLHTPVGTQLMQHKPSKTLQVTFAELFHRFSNKHMHDDPLLLSLPATPDARYIVYGRSPKTILDWILCKVSHFRLSDVAVLNVFFATVCHCTHP
jgi:hypothetical protein